MITPAANGGSCAPLQQTIKCDVPCKLSAWSDWSECVDKSQRRARVITQDPFNNGAACEAPLVETRTCNPSQDCVQGPWQDSGTCNPSTGKKTQVRSWRGSCWGGAVCKADALKPVDGTAVQLPAPPIPHAPDFSAHAA